MHQGEINPAKSCIFVCDLMGYLGEGK